MTTLGKNIKWVIFLCLLVFIILVSCSDDDQHTTTLKASITGPGHGATVTGIVPITINVSDNAGLTKVEFYIDNILKCTGIPPCKYNWDTTAVVDGSHTIKARAYDEKENSAEHSITVNVDNVADAVGWIGGGSNGWKTGTAPVFGSDYQSFNGPNSIYIDITGNIYVTDFLNHRISKWDKNGNAIGWIGGGSDGWKTGAITASGSDYRSFNKPISVYVDSAGNIYVTDLVNHRISRWNTNGNAIGWIGGAGNGWKTGDAPASGTNDYQSFSWPISVYADSAGNIYVADSGNHRISKWNTNGNAIGWIGGAGNGWKTGDAPVFASSDYQSFKGPSGVHADSAGNIYVADSGNHRISKWNNNGNAIGWIGGAGNGWKTGDAPAFGTNDYQSFKGPSGVHADGAGNIYVADFLNHRISKWDNNGNAIGWIGGAGNGWKTATAPASGSDYQSFNSPHAVYVDSAGNIYVTDGGNHRISKWKD